MAPGLLWWIDAAMLVAITSLLWHRRLEARDLHAFLKSAAPLPAKARDAALEIASACYGLPRRSTDPPFLTFLPALGATPSAVLRQGGCCSGRARVLILALASIGIRAFQVTLYHRSGRAQHCLVQAWVDDEPLLLDPTYGVYYSQPQGGTVGLAELQAGIVPELIPLHNTSGTGYPDNEYYDFAYAASQTANWTMSRPRRLLHRGLCLVLGRGRVSRLEVPAFLEWPHNVLVLAALLALATLHTLGLLVR